MRDSLFRQEVLDEQKKRLLGQVLIQIPGTAQGLVWLLTSLFVVAMLFLFCGRYNRREEAIGVLTPNRGAIKIQVQRSGSLSSIHVTEGQKVEQNQVLFSLSSDRILATGIEVNQVSIDELNSLTFNLNARIDSLPERQQSELKRLETEMEESTRKLKLLQTQKNLCQKRLQLKMDRKNRATGLAEEKLISANDFQDISEAVIQLQNEMQDAEKAILANESQARALEAAMSRLPDDFQKQKVELLQQLTAAKERLMELNLEKSQQIVAPVKGRITSLQAYPGMTIDPAKPLAVLLPEGGRLEAHLFVPSRAIGFIKQGQTVLLQYEAFPAAKFGMQIGQIREISRTVLNPVEIHEMDLRGQDEAYYRLTVDLQKEAIQAFGQDFPLQSGMKVDADIVLERRTLLEWILEPLLRGGS